MHILPYTRMVHLKGDACIMPAWLTSGGALCDAYCIHRSVVWRSSLANTLGVLT